MSERAFQIAFLLLGVMVLGSMGMLAKRRVRGHQDMSVGGRTFRASDIFFSLYAFWGGNTIAGIVELAHSNGIFSVWFGISRMIMFFLILFITGGRFRRLRMITLSNFVSQRFQSPFLGLLSGSIIVANFTIFTVSSVVGATAFFTAILGWPVWVSVIFTVFSFLMYTALGGMYALAYNGRILTIGQLVALFVAAIIGIHMAGWENILSLEGKYFEILPRNHLGTILVWLFTFIINAFTAQAAIQIVMACKNVNEARKGIIYVVLAFIPIIILAPLVGMAARVLFPAIQSIQAMPMLASSMPSLVLSTIVVLGLYFTTLGWASSCILSGGTVAANDIYRYFAPDASSEQLIRVSRLAIAALSLLTVGFAILIPSGVEFWTIVGFVLRNTGLFPLVVVGLFWNAISRRAAIAGAIAGSGVGLFWYLISYPSYLFNAHPMFVGMLASIGVVIGGTLLDHRGKMRVALSRTGICFGVLFLLSTFFTVTLFGELMALKLFFAFVSVSVSFFFVAFIFSVKRLDGDVLPLDIPLDDEGSFERVSR